VRTARKAGEARGALVEAMDGYPGSVWAWVGCTEQELHDAVRAAVNDYYL
jgi:hypothetical protein